MVFALTSISEAKPLFAFLNKKSRITEYRSKKHKRKMHKRSQRAYKNACKNSYILVSAYGVKR